MGTVSIYMTAILTHRCYENKPYPSIIHGRTLPHAIRRYPYVRHTVRKAKPLPSRLNFGLASARHDNHDPMRRLSEVFIDQYRTAAGEGAVLELKMRLLADKVPELRKVCGDRLEDVEGEIIRLFAADLIDGEASQLKACRQLRNKVLHCDFPTARAKLRELGAPDVRGSVRQIAVTATSPEGIRQQIEEAVSGKEGSSQAVADLTGRGEGRIFGWLLELGAACEFVTAATIFRTATAIIDRLVLLASERE